MDTKSSLKQIISDLKSNDFYISAHALERMSERGLASIDIIALIESEGLDDPVWNKQHESWNFSGKGFTDSIFTIACTYETDGTLIVTVFWR